MIRTIRLMFTDVSVMTIVLLPLLAVMLADKAATPAEFAEVESYLDAAKNAPEAAAQRHYGAGLLALRRQEGARAAAELTEAARLDPAADVTFYKLAQAQRMCGNSDASSKALAEYERRQKLNHDEFGLQGDVSQHPDQPTPYLKLADFYERNGHAEEAKAMREIARQRFSPDTLSKRGALLREGEPSVSPVAGAR